MTPTEPLRTADARPRLAQVDIARGLTAITVVIVHAAAYSMGQDPAGSVAHRTDQALVLTFRFARAVFMFLTGFVLAYAYRETALRARTFVAHRVLRTAVPYLAWSGVYLAVARAYGLPGPSGPWAQAYLEAIALGSAAYHFYFMSVSLQWYLLFPLVLPWFRAVRGAAARRAAIAAGAFQVAVAAYLTAGAPGLPETGFVQHALFIADRLLPAYLGIYVMGSLAGMHADVVLERLRRAMVPAALVAAALLGWILVDRLAWPIERFGEAADVFRFDFTLYTLATVAVVIGVAGRVAHSSGRGRRVLLAMARDSYPIFLAHPLVLFLIEWYVLPRFAHHPVIVLPLVIAGVAVPMALARVIRATPLAPLLLGQGPLARPRSAIEVPVEEPNARRAAP